MLKILILAAVVGAFAFALSVAGFSAWQSLQQKQQASHETSTEKPTEQSSQATSHVSSKETSDEAIARYTLWLMGFTGVLAFVALIQIGFLISADDTASRAASAALKSADAAEKSSTAGRAYLFILPKGQVGGFDPGGQNATGPYRPSVGFSIKNFGPTPAIITKVETHLYLSDGKPGGVMPVPNSPEAKAMAEATQWAISAVEPITPTGGISRIDTSPDAKTRIMLAGGAESGALEQTFVFHKGWHSTMWAWFYCAITYKDIFGGKDRHTYLYVQLGGTGFSYPQNSEYNSWD
jgi:hypothetical protein